MNNCGKMAWEPKRSQRFVDVGHAYLFHGINKENSRFTAASFLSGTLILK